MDHYSRFYTTNSRNSNPTTTDHMPDIQNIAIKKLLESLVNKDLAKTLSTVSNIQYKQIYSYQIQILNKVF